jgi:hypothetical protein
VEKLVQALDLTGMSQNAVLEEANKLLDNGVGGFRSRPLEQGS